MQVIAKLLNTLALSLGAMLWLAGLTSCAKKEPKQPISMDEKLALIQNKFELYSTLIKKHEDSYGWILTDDCDALLFSGLTSVAGRDPSLLEARNESGQWFRRPLSYEPCYVPESGKGSTISRDMFMGLLWHLWRKQDLQTAEELFGYGLSHDWIMGEGEASRIYFSPALQATLAEIIFRLGGQNHTFHRNIPQAWFPSLHDFPLHLQTLHILLRGELFKGLGSTTIHFILSGADAEPNNALTQLAKAIYHTGDYNAVADLLLNEQWWPTTRLPTTHDRKTEWLNQRRFYTVEGEVNPDWLPFLDEPAQEHTGGDFLFVAKLLLEQFKVE